jgi:hypothetical protein
MDNLTEELKEKNINFWIRNILRLMAWVVLLFYMVFRILIPIKDKEKVILDQNDGWVIFACMCLLLAIEGVRAVVKARLKKFTGDSENNLINQLRNENNDEDGEGGVIPGKGY